MIVTKFAYVYILYEVSVKENHIYKGKNTSPVKDVVLFLFTYLFFHQKIIRKFP